jgi:hypothetical protein
MNTVFVRSPYNYDRRAASEESALKIPPSEEDMAQQQFKEECDINTIMRRFGVTGVLPNGPVGNYGDFTDIDDFTSAMNAVRQASEAFMDLPVALRRRFGHDPQEFINFIENDNNREEAQRLGLVPTPAPVVRETTTEPPAGPPAVS